LTYCSAAVSTRKVADKRYLSEGSMALLNAKTDPKEVAAPALLTA
jgi:hypothetical protein